MKALLDEQSLVRANAQFWEQMLAMQVDTMPSATQFCVDAGHLVGYVVMGGAWKGRVEVRMASNLAYEATAAMLMQPLESVGESDALDAAKEIANMIAGTIKSSLPRPCSMSVPGSAVEAAGFCGQARTDDALAVGFHHQAGDMMVYIWEQECVAGA
jgi:CheY-specific phosphatase CheX